ncbi:ABC transporter permease [Corynebacterium qintianiae]|uniref:ABC transporter permease n=1 Tax=Corynebacterium qintianiae TaxID=2709392 RepID=A0A7T0KM56_9CORY|nr:ABC transporter permease [Corynebacterium qintianiae]QPK83047.1 ABC transporter permease [Corynebacterium qintianiae]
MLNLFPAEWTKLRSTASFFWTTGLILAAAAGFAAIFAAPAGGGMYIPITVIMTVGMISAIIVIVQAAMVVTTEYRFGVQATNFRLAPQRWQVALAKLLLYAALAAATVFLASVLAFTLGDALASVPANWTSNAATLRALWALPLGAALLVMFTHGVGWIVRNTAGTVTLVFAMQFVAETVIGFIPRVGRDIVGYMPFSNLFAFMFNTPTQNHGVWASLGIFAAWALAAWVVGVVLLHRRDA